MPAVAMDAQRKRAETELVARAHEADESLCLDGKRLVEAHPERTAA